MSWMYNIQVPLASFNLLQEQEGQKCPKRRVAQATIRLATAVITFRNKERNVRSPCYGKCVRRAKKCKTCNLCYIIVSML